MPEGTVQRWLRLDLNQGEITNRRRTPQGGLILDGHIARVGVQEYRNPDGSVRRELRLPEEVFSKETLDSFSHAPITVDHPGGLVSPDNWRRVSVGHLGAAVEKGGRFADAEHHVQDAHAIRDIESGHLSEISCGYTCRLDMTPGVHPEFGPYDAIQRDIRGNHVAIGPKGWARGGPELQLHLDGGESVSGFEPGSYVRATMAEKTTTTGGGTGTETQTQTAPAPAAAREDSATLAGENGQLKAENARLTRELAQRTDAEGARAEQARIDSAVKTRIALERSVLAVAKHVKCDGKTDDAVRREVLTHLEPELELPAVTEDGADRYVIGAFDSAVRRADKATRATGQTRVASPTGERGESEGTRSDGKKPPADAIEDARDQMVAKDAGRWNKPKGDTKGRK